MALWYIASLGWGVHRWWDGEGAAFFFVACGVGSFAGILLRGQDGLLDWVRRWRLRTSFKFFATAAAASGFYEALQLGISVARATARGQMALLISALISWLPLLVLWFVGWYGTWWVVLRTGWVNVPSGLIAAFEFVLAAEGKSIAAKRVIAWIAPGIVAFTVVILARSLWEPAEMRWFSV